VSRLNRFESSLRSALAAILFVALLLITSISFLAENVDLQSQGKTNAELSVTHITTVTLAWQVPTYKTKEMKGGRR
jgi:hypothetical protein